MKILVADDSLTFMMLISDSLKRLGHEVIQAHNGEDAILLFAKHRPDLVILDVMMEKMGGFECARKMREINPEDWVPIIFLSASVDDESIAKGIEAGGDDYLTKPYSEMTLEAKIKAMQRISEMRQQLFITTEELKRLSSTDVLTGLYNRFQFERSLREHLASADRHQYSLALLFVDLDYFKAVNDNFGHRVGDLLLSEVAARIKKCTRLDDFVARIGGDEFVIILSQIDHYQVAGEVSKKIVDALSADFMIDGHKLKISASVGVVCYPDQKVDATTLIQKADIAMYAAKEIGRNNFQYYTDALNEKHKQQVGIEHELKFALERNQLYIAYQPIYNLLTKKMIGAEALLRWKHPHYGLISPNIFIPIAEETGLIIDIGTWALREAAKQGAKWVAAGCSDFKLSVNLSLHQFIHDGFMTLLVGILKESKMPAKNIELELTESTVITFTSHLKDTMKQLQDLGIGIGIDDFGTRYSSLTSLKYLPITTLKIDKAFVKNVDSDKKNNIIVKSLIALGENLSLRVIAEGVQTEEQMQFLIINGCHYAQGFLFNKALKPELITKMIDEGKLIHTIKRPV